MSEILIVCPNLAVDRTLRCPSLRSGEVHRASGVYLQAGGKGVNVARALQSLASTSALAPGIAPIPHVIGMVGGLSGKRIEDGLLAEGIPHTLCPMDRENRTCTIILEQSADSEKTNSPAATVVNEPGPRCDRSEEQALIRLFERSVMRASAVAFMGSLPPGFRPEFYAELIRSCNEARIPSLVDTSEAALDAAVRSMPTVLKPNEAEARALLGLKSGNPFSDSDWLNRLRSWNTAGIALALVSFGAEGVLASTFEWQARLVDRQGGRDASSVHSSQASRSGQAPRVRVNATGAGDSLAAGILAGLAAEMGEDRAVRLGVACASASLEKGYGRFAPESLNEGRIETIEIEPRTIREHE